MANTFKVLSRAAATTGSYSTVYTVPASTITLVTNIIVTNVNAAAQTYYVQFDDIAFADAFTVPAKDSIIVEPKQVLVAGDTIKTYASSADVKFHISGLEIA
jgi:hypothetical protein